jgi:caa(3)-type oxidase subunit IV
MNGTGGVDSVATGGAHMTERADTHHRRAHAPASYVKIWALLVGLLVVSLLGPLAGMLWVTLIAAFGVAIVKAVIVAAYFMHLNVERTYIKYLLLTLLGLVLVLFAGVAPDVMQRVGQNWRHLPSSSAASPSSPSPEVPSHH